jgi:dihydropteroate synthase
MQKAKTIIMGVLNVTPDSFSDGGQYVAIEKAIERAKIMAAQGADIIDIGGESTRPGSNPATVKEELGRVIPIIKEINKEISLPISIDTSKPEVMEKAVIAGASMINDVSALSADGAISMASSLGVKVCLMHMKGKPRTMQDSPTYDDVIDELKTFFSKRISDCVMSGIKNENIIIDPGFGFGKTLNHNLEILKRLREFSSLKLPIMVGISRKSMIGSLLNNRPVDGRIIGSVTAALVAVQNGASIVRVHDVLETRDALDILESVNDL